MKKIFLFLILIVSIFPKINYVTLSDNIKGDSVFIYVNEDNEVYVCIGIS